MIIRIHSQLDNKIYENLWLYDDHESRALSIMDYQTKKPIYTYIFPGNNEHKADFCLNDLCKCFWCGRNPIMSGFLLYRMPIKLMKRTPAYILIITAVTFYGMNNTTYNFMNKFSKCLFPLKSIVLKW